MPAGPHEVNIDINCGSLSFVALLAIKDARVLVAAQIIHQFIFPLFVMILICLKILNFFLFLW